MQFQEFVPLSTLTTFRAGGPARYFFEVHTKDELREALLFAKEKNLSFFILGGGSNTLFGDHGFSGVVIRISLLGRKWSDTGDASVSVTLQSGEEWESCVEESVRRNLYGFENLSLIPGRVGATAIQNIGAYGVEVSSVIESVEVFDSQSFESRTLGSSECVFGYRDSIFKKEAGKHLIVTAVTYRLKRHGALSTSYRDVDEYFKTSGIPITLASVREAIIAIRKRKLPDINEVGTAGSFFKNPVITKEAFGVLKLRFPEMPGFLSGQNMVKVPAGWLLDHVGNFKGVRRGNASVWNRQALVIVNEGEALTSEIISLASEMSEVILKETGITLEPEVIIVNE